MATAINGAMCQWHMFSTDRNEVQTNAADGKISGTIDTEVNLSIHYGPLIYMLCTDILVTYTHYRNRSPNMPIKRHGWTEHTPTFLLSDIYPTPTSP